jgi:cobyrinic acid a,c-diamide synthase
LALIAVIRNLGLHVQHFRSLAAFTPIDFVTPLTGLASRHLDPWMMNDELCRKLFVHSAAPADVAIIEGCTPYPASQPAAGGWPSIAQLLNCPVIGVVLNEPSEEFHAPPLPAPVDALFIDQFESREQFYSKKGVLEEIYRKPVLGGLEAGESTRDVARIMRCGRTISGVSLDELLRRTADVTDATKLLTLARSRPLSPRPPQLRKQSVRRQAMRVAIAYDDCFRCYFPETLDALELLGADICEFSPLTDDRLPADADIVYLGCGHPEAYSALLAENECMRAALRQHVCAGKRLYAEGGGTAYLCQHLLISGTKVPMVGIFAADAEFTERPLPRPQPVELVCQRSNWISKAGGTIRGYRTGAWRMHPRGDFTPSFKSDCDEPEILVRHHGVGSTVHMNFAAQPTVLDAFFAAHAPSLSI